MGNAELSSYCSLSGKGERAKGCLAARDESALGRYEELKSGAAHLRGAEKKC